MPMWGTDPIWRWKVSANLPKGQPGRLFPCSLEAEADDALDQLRVGEAGLHGGLREIFVLGEDGVGVRFDEIDFVVRSHAQVEARVAVNGEEVIDAFAPLLDVRGERGIESLGELVLQAPAFAVFLVPLGAVGGNLGLVG